MSAQTRTQETELLISGRRSALFVKPAAEGKIMNKLKVSHKLLGGFLAIAIIAATIGVIGIFKLHQLSDQQTVLYHNGTIAIADMSDVVAAVGDTRIAMRDAVYQAKNAQELMGYEAGVMDARAEATKAYERLAKHHLSPDMKQAYDQMITDRAAFRQEVDSVMNYARAGNKTAARDMIDQNAKDKFRESVRNVQRVGLKEAEELDVEGDKIAAGGTLALVIALVLGVGLAIVLGFMISRAITKPLGEMM